MATWATTSMLRDRCRSRLALTVRVGPRLTVARLREYFQAGIAPKNRPDKSESKKVNRSEPASREISLRRGRFAGPMETRKRTAATATPIPKVPPSRPSNTLSKSSSRAILPRPAPSAARTESSSLARLGANQQQIGYIDAGD